MAGLSVEQLLEPIPGDDPCGEDLEYDPAFMDMESAAVGRPEQQFGDTVIPAEEPDWKQVRKAAETLFERTKDLRVGTYLTRAALCTDGLPGFRDGLTVLCGLVERYWDNVHPRLDPDDDNDPTMRINALLSLCDAGTALRALREAPLVSSRGLGTFGYRHVLVANGELAATGDNAVDMAGIDAAFADCDLEQLRATADAVQESLEAAQRLEQMVTEQVGAANAPSLSDMTDLLRAIHRLLQERLARRGVFEQTAVEAADSDGGELAEVESTSGNGAAVAVVTRTAAPAAPLGDIASREEVIRALDKICQYYARYEPSSPVPLLLKRAKRLASKSFLEILRDLTPEAVQQALSIGGISEDGSGNEGWEHADA